MHHGVDEGRSCRFLTSSTEVSLPVPRRTLLEWLLGSVAAEVPNSRLASALRRKEGSTPEQ
jgi:hypothetical protein